MDLISTILLIHFKQSHKGKFFGGGAQVALVSKVTEIGIASQTPEEKKIRVQ